MVWADRGQRTLDLLTDVQEKSYDVKKVTDFGAELRDAAQHDDFDGRNAVQVHHGKWPGGL